MANTEKGYLVQLKSPEGENVYPVIPPEAIVKSDGSTYDFDSLFTSVSNGKALVASAITDKGVETAADATYQQMAENIGKLKVPAGVVANLMDSVSYKISYQSTYGRAQYYDSTEVRMESSLSTGGYQSTVINTNESYNDNDAMHLHCSKLSMRFIVKWQFTVVDANTIHYKLYSVAPNGSGNKDLIYMKILKVGTYKDNNGRTTNGVAIQIPAGSRTDSSGRVTVEWTRGNYWVAFPDITLTASATAQSAKLSPENFVAESIE